MSPIIADRVARRRNPNRGRCQSVSLQILRRVGSLISRDGGIAGRREIDRSNVDHSHRIYPMNAEWYRDFFQGVAVELWRNAVPAEQTRREATFLAEMLELQDGARVLDVPCGHGRHSIELASRGFRVTGVDISETCLSFARDDAKASGVSVHWLQAEMRELPVDEPFDAAYCVGNSLGYLDHAGTQAFLNRLSTALRPGARVVFDSGMAAESILTNFKSHEEYTVGEITMVIDNRYRVRESCLETHFTFRRNGVTEERGIWHFVFTLAELGRMLAGAGLRVEACHSSCDKQPYVLGSEYLYLVARKNGD
jgi:2-polyprenyl-3-methyl-5-hydroxy-6-metoxy-1,4-benzoquinol methylase